MEPSEQDSGSLLWQHRQNLNADFNNLGNFFMLAQSFLLAVAVQGSEKGGRATLLTTALPAFGVLLTIIWMYVQAKQRALLEAVKKRCAEKLPEYKTIREARTSSRWILSNTAILSYGLPALFLTAWLVAWVA